MLYRYFIELSFDGTNYHGWQVQPNATTVQQKLNEVLSLLLKEQVETTGAGRTDTGVHAVFFVAHFDTAQSNIDKDNNIIFKLNQITPDDIGIQRIRKVKPDAHARFNALSRTYNYYVVQKKTPFNRQYAHFLYGNIDIDIMNRACLLLKEFNDFTSFSKLHTENKTNNCIVSEAQWTKEENTLKFTITADRFLRNMVRAIVGTMLDLGMNKIRLEDFQHIIKAKERSKASQSAPAKGLFLTSITYPPDIYLP